jgi:6-pyruvoyltetrahydropterin/6-carboxytetrahydropterin synthase
MKKKLATVTIEKEDMKFSSGHFTIFSKTHRENMHGHNFTVRAEISAAYDVNGMAFDYRFYKKRLYELCDELDGYFLLPISSEYLRIDTSNPEVVNVYFADEKLTFLPRDVKFMPMCNITVEELAEWFIQQLVTDQTSITEFHIVEIAISVFTMPGQGAERAWRAAHKQE